MQNDLCLLDLLQQGNKLVIDRHSGTNKIYSIQLKIKELPKSYQDWNIIDDLIFSSI